VENYYKLLDIKMEADKKEIKKAYKKKLRKYPPEKAPEKFKKIRNAYETLNDEKSRKEYDAIIKYEDEIEDYMDKGINNYQNQNYKKAEKLFKKVIVIESTLSYARNFLGLVYLEQNKLDKAIEQFKKVVDESPENPSYLFNLGTAYMNKEKYNKAEYYLKKAYENDKVDPSIVLALADTYFNQKKDNKVFEILREAINHDGKVDFEDFMYFFKMVEIHISLGNIDKAEKVLEEIEDIIPNDKEAREYVAYRFGQLGSSLFDLQAYDLSKKITGWALNIDPNNEAISELYNAASDLDEIYNLYQKLEEDEKVIDPIIGPIYFSLFSNVYDYSEEELEKYYRENMQAIESFIQNNPEPLVNSIERIKKRYRKLYNFNDDIKTIIDEAYYGAKENLRFFEEVEKFNNDSIIIDEFKTLVALWLTNSYTENEKKKRINEVFDSLDYKMRMGLYKKILKSVRRIKKRYSQVYNMNKNLFDDLKENLLEIDRQNNNSIDESYKDYNKRNKSNENYNNSNCFVATAAFGTKWADEINILRDWRDERLQHNKFGRIFINFYYKVGPFLAKFVRRSSLLKNSVRKIIYFIIKMIDY